MKRRLNVSLWAGFLIVLSAPVIHLSVLIRFPATRDVPWVTLLMFAAGLVLIARGLRRAYREPLLYRGKIAGAILMVLGIAMFGLFGFGTFYLARQLPPSRGAPQVGRKAADFTLPDKDGNPVTLSKIIDAGAGGADRVNGVLLIFYRGYW